MTFFQSLIGVISSSGAGGAPLDITTVGGTRNVVGIYSYHTWTSNDTFTLNTAADRDIEFCIIGGGGSAGKCQGGTSQGVVFEGTADSHETFLIATNPTTTDRTITLPDCTGTVLTTGNPNDNILTFNAQTGTSYTLVLTDGGKMITSSNGSAQTITVPPNSSVAFPVGTQIIVQNLGSANATLAQGSGVTLQSKDSNKEIDGQYASAALIKTATDTWSLIGALT